MPSLLTDSPSRRQRPASLGLARRRRRGIARVIALLSVLVLSATVALAMVANWQIDAAERDEAMSWADQVAVVDEGQRAQSVARSSRTTTQGTGHPPFASVDGLVLHLPHEKTAAVAFHEASRSAALEMAPVGSLLGNDNPTKYQPVGDTDGAAYHVLASRGRAGPATSAVDVVVPDGATVVAPVTGTVVQVADYPLYGEIDDYRVEIRSDSRPGLAVVLIHLENPQVAVGERVEAGTTPVATVRRLPLESQVDALVGERSPHVHIEVKAALPPAPVDPNAPAVEPTEGS